MNARKHREIGQAIRDWLRLGPKGRQSGSGPSLWPDAQRCTAGVQSGPKSFIVMAVEHGKAVSLVPARNRADLTVRRVRRNSIGRTEKAKAGGNALDTPTSVWSEMAGNTVESLQPRQQMTANASWLMRLGVSAHWSRAFNDRKEVLPSCARTPSRCGSSPAGQGLMRA